MASRGGAIPLGTDGTDYLHRQRVAEHYQKRYRKLGKRKIFVTIFNQDGIFHSMRNPKVQKSKNCV